MEYNFKEVEKKWQNRWREQQIYKAEIDSSKPKYYVLDMFPYPSGAGLHVGHPLGYIASDIYSRYKRLKGFNVLHPMGYDAFGLPAEQYAIQTGQHPAITTEQNIARYREQLDNIGFSFDWSREVRTSDPSYYKWTQWIFIQLFNSWYNQESDKAEPIETLIEKIKSNKISIQTNKKWEELSEAEQQEILQNYRLAFLSETTVNWCPALGTVLANEEVKDGVSERGGYPVERKLMKQWSLRITAYAQRLLDDLDTIDWTDSLKEQQRNWIGRSEGAQLEFKVMNSTKSFEVFTTRPDTIFGVSFMTLAPEHALVNEITTAEQKSAVQNYVEEAKNRSDRERMTEVKRISGVFTGAYAEHPFTKKTIPIWIGDYVLAGYGTGAVMAVPGHDERDHAFAKHFSLPILQVVEAPASIDIMEQSFDAKEGKCINSDFLNGLEVKRAIRKAIEEIEKKGIGSGKVNFRLRDAIFGRQRYWGEPIPIYYKDGIPYPLEEKDLPLVLPEVDAYLPTEDGEPPLARARQWKYKGQYDYELTTMPGWAGSSWYFLRYMDAHNDKEFASKEALNYWQDVDLYMGGAEHATGHLLYVRFWTKFLYDLGFIPVQEPAKKLINQGMIQGRSNFVYRIKDSNKYVSFNLKKQYDTTPIHIDVNMVENDELNLDQFKGWRPEFENAEFILENGRYICGSEIEKMSKRWHNVVNPDDMVNRYGADCLRLYEMFLGPLELSKPWNTNGISGTSNFIRKLWKLYHRQDSNSRDLVWDVSDAEPTKAELKALHKTIKKIVEDIDRYSFNTSVSNFMICVNELTDLKCNKRAILEPLAIIVSPYSPHIAEELWEKLGHKESITKASFPEFREEFMTEDAFDYPISVNGKTKFNLNIALSLSKEEIEREVMNADEVKKLLAGSTPKKVVVVPGRIVNIVV
ncbi:MAG TPA: leucine--tRNA ligase [Bacteroidia bacterium]|nr:leucine--tRNA ligase [Bacteroidia bacterium]